MGADVVEAAALLLLVSMVGLFSFLAGALMVCRAIRLRYPAAYWRIRSYQVDEARVGRKLYPQEEATPS